MSSDLREDQAQIGEVLIRYATGIDQRDWPLFRSCWTPQIDADYGDLGRFTDVDAITDVMTRAHQDMGPTHHRMTNFAITVDGDRASVRSYVHSLLMLSPDEPGNWVDVVGHYDDVFVRTSEGWRITRRITHIARMLTSGDVPRLDSLRPPGRLDQKKEQLA